MGIPWHEWPSVWHDLSRLLLAYLLALPVGWFREREAHSVGLRTFPLVAVASCGYLLLGTDSHMGADAQSRIIQGMVAGMGFIGGGAIMRAGRQVHGTAAAAAIWNTGAVGAAVALDRFFLAVALSALNLFALRLLLPLKEKLDRDQ